MFSSKKQQQQLELDRYLRRVRDLTCPTATPLEGESRARERENRSLPALLAPWEDDTFSASECTYAVTKDLSDSGLSLVLPQPFRSTEVLVGFWPVSHHHPACDTCPFFAIGEVRQNVCIGGGFWQLGISLERPLLDEGIIDRLTPLAARLLPKSAVKRAATADVLAPLPR